MGWAGQPSMRMGRARGAEMDSRCGGMTTWLGAGPRLARFVIPAGASLQPRLAAAQLLDAAPLRFGLQPPRLAGEGGASGPAGLGRDGGLAQELDETSDGVVAVERLGAEAIGGDDDFALGVEPGAGPRRRPRLDRLRQGGVPEVEAELGSGRNLVDVLPARTRGADEADVELGFVDRQRGGDGNAGGNGGPREVRRAIITAPAKTATRRLAFSRPGQSKRRSRRMVRQGTRSRFSGTSPGVSR